MESNFKERDAEAKFKRLVRLTFSDSKGVVSEVPCKGNNSKGNEKD